MQPLFDELQKLTAGQISLTFGLLLVGLLTAQGLTGIFRGWLRLRTERKIQRAELEKLRLQVREARLRCEEVEQGRFRWNGYRKFSVAKKARECDDVCAFYLKPHDGKPLPPFKPGQYLTFELDIPGRDKPVVRCYSLSDGPHRSEYYRVTIKKEKCPANRPELPPGVASSYFLDTIKEGDILNVKAPTGHFSLDTTKTNPIVLIAGGVGVTPLLCMAHAIAASGSKREAWFFFGVRNGQEHIHKAELQQLAADHENIHLHVCYSRPGPSDVKGRDYQHEGRVSIDLLKQVLPSNNFEYFLCGSGAFMKDLTDGLEAWGVPEKEVHFEAFGPATVKKKAAPLTTSETSFLSKVQVTFGRSGKVVRWEPSAGNLLEFAQAQGVRIESGCCAGSCGSCLVAIKSGAVHYLKPPDAEPEQGACLTCICRPEGDLVLDA
jgi:ferredoxin-NADP reductase